MPSVTRKSRTRTRRGTAAQQVLTAVEELLEEGESFTALGVGRIADRAGIARSSFYVHFPDKTALLLRLTESATDELFQAVESWIDDDEADLESLTATLAALISEYRAHAALLAAVAEVATYEPEVAEFWRARIQRSVDALRRRLERDRRAGRISRDISSADTAEYIAWGTERTIGQRMVTDPEGTGDARLAEGIARSIWTIMTAPPSP